MIIALSTLFFSLERSLLRWYGFELSKTLSLDKASEKLSLSGLSEQAREREEAGECLVLMLLFFV